MFIEHKEKKYKNKKHNRTDKIITKSSFILPKKHHKNVKNYG